MISVIVPVHNGEKTLSKCVDSILDSTVSDIEIILVENGSTDRTINNSLNRTAYCIIIEIIRISIYAQVTSV